MDARRRARAALGAAALAAAAALAPAGTDAPGAAPRDRRFALVDSTPPLAAAPDSAVIVLAREQFVRKNPLPPERLYLDGAPLGWLPQQSAIVVAVAPGLHRLSGVFECPDLVVGCAPGETVLLRLRETIDDVDRLRLRWLLDEPAAAAGLLRGAALPLAVPSARGLADLAKRAGRPAGAAPDTAAALAPDGRLAFPEVLFEHPLDPMNLRRDFSILTGALSLGGARLDYVERRVRGEVRISIPLDSVETVRFGGTRYVGRAPWLDVIYRDGDRRWRASFADAREESAEATYNRLFAALAAHVRRPAAAR